MNTFANVGRIDRREKSERPSLDSFVAKAATLLGLDQPKISALARGRTDGYSIDRLFKFLNALGRLVEITVRPTANTSTVAETRVVIG